MSKYQQSKESNIYTKTNQDKGKIEKVFSKIYDYVIKRMKEESFFKQGLRIVKARFNDYVVSDASFADVTLFNLESSDVKVFILNPTIKYMKGQTVLLGYYNDYKNLFLLGPIEKNSVEEGEEK